MIGRYTIGRRKAHLWTSVRLTWSVLWRNWKNSLSTSGLSHWRRRVRMDITSTDLQIWARVSTGVTFVDVVDDFQRSVGCVVSYENSGWQNMYWSVGTQSPDQDDTRMFAFTLLQPDLISLFSWPPERIIQRVCDGQLFPEAIIFSSSSHFDNLYWPSRRCATEQS